MSTRSMRKRVKLKYKLNYNAAIFNPKTKEFKKEEWICDKCKQTFSAFNELRLHKNDVHSY